MKRARYRDTEGERPACFVGVLLQKATKHLRERRIPHEKGEGELLKNEQRKAQ